MSQYTDLIKDYPARCAKLLKDHQADFKRKGTGVTFTLMVAAAGIIMPYERLKADGRFPHPSKDNKRYPKAAAAFDTLLTGTIKDSNLWPTTELPNWFIGSLVSAEPPITNWLELQAPPILKVTDNTDRVVTTIRHALAHGAVYTDGDGYGNIGELIFVSNEDDKSLKNKTPHRFVKTTPKAFRTFLYLWFKWFEKMPLA